MADLNTALHKACDYLNKDRALHMAETDGWHLDPGKLQTALESADLAVAMVDPRDLILRRIRDVVGNFTDWLNDNANDGEDAIPPIGDDYNDLHSTIEALLRGEDVDTTVDKERHEGR